MDLLQPFINIDSEDRITISAEQGSRFAKEIAGDFNPIHNADAKRFCVPGDLLFAIALNRYGLHASMQFNFLDMLAADAAFTCPTIDSDSTAPSLSDESLSAISTTSSTANSTNISSTLSTAFSTTLSTTRLPQLIDHKGKPLLGIAASGEQTHEPAKINQLIRNYVRFSGQNFPHILVPLMRQSGVMINPARPLVIYESMAFELDNVNAQDISLTLEDSTLDANGKRGNVALIFSLQSNGKTIGRGLKKLVLSGLRDYDESTMTELADSYLASRDAYPAKH